MDNVNAQAQDSVAIVTNNIFAGVIKKEEGVEVRRQDFLKVFNNPKVFENEYYVFAVLVRDYPKLELSKTFLENFLNANRPSLETSPNIDLQKYRLSDLEPFVEFMNSCINIHADLQKVVFTKEQYLEGLEIYKMNYINEESIKLLEESVAVLSEGIKERGKIIVGYDDMRTHLKNGFLRLDEMTNKSDRKGLITYGINDMDDAERERDTIKLITTYGVAGLDKHLGGIYQGDMVSLLAPAKGGKSRLSTFILHNAVVNHKTNILMWSIENGYKGWEALIRARHFEYFYNQTATDGSQRKWVDDDMVRKGAMSPEVKSMELASWTDLKSNPKYGKITSIDEDFNVDTFVEIVDNAVQATGATLICIDYLQLVQGAGRASKQERVAEAYQKTLQLLKMRRIAGIFPAQLKQTVVGDLNKVDEADLINKELRDAAGESYEVIKTPDVNLALYGSVEEIRQGKMKILSIPSRNHAPFEPVSINCAMGSCTFVDAAVAERS